jgi:hypothetical protein
MVIKKNIALSSFILLGLISGFLLNSCGRCDAHAYFGEFASDAVTVSVPVQNTYKVDETLTIDFFIKRKIPQQTYSCEQGEANMAFEIGLQQSANNGNDVFADIEFTNYLFFGLGYIQQDNDTIWHYNNAYHQSNLHLADVIENKRPIYNATLDNFHTSVQVTFKQKGHYVLKTFKVYPPDAHLYFYPSFLIFDGALPDTCRKTKKPKRCDLVGFTIPLDELSKLDRDIFVD